ncbi:hypothetical protein H0H93_003034 [Arthromyces matolae]|nr:hypothetical protein H0H93_003034 [Arthromyces matolae]
MANRTGALYLDDNAEIDEVLEFSCLLASVIMMSGATPIPTASDTLTSSHDGVQLISRSPPQLHVFNFGRMQQLVTTPGPHPHTIQRLLSGFQEDDLDFLRAHGAAKLATNMAEFVGPEKSKKWDKDKFLIVLWLYATRLVEAVKSHWEAEATWYALAIGNQLPFYSGLKAWGKRERIGVLDHELSSARIRSKCECIRGR